MSRVVRIAALVVVWIVLWGSWSVPNLLGGLVVAAVVVGVSNPWRSGSMVIRPLRALVFLGSFVLALVRSGWSVALAVLAPTSRIHSGIVTVELTGCSDALLTLVANAISLTPGTLTLQVRSPGTLFVHALDTSDPLRLQRELEALAARALAAFAPSGAHVLVRTGEPEVAA
jgi:multicomponent Na+:H+ antiporter subunit E